MKILALRLKNLNSLKGEWTLDFRQPPFAGNGLFAITGPTGAGKRRLAKINAKFALERVQVFQAQREDFHQAVSASSASTWR